MDRIKKNQNCPTGLVGQDEPVKILAMVNSIEDLTGYDYLVSFKEK